MGDIENFHVNVSKENLKTLFQSASFTETVTAFQAYQEFLRRDNGDLSAFWTSYTDMIEVLLGLIRASREGNWQLHLCSIRNILPWCFAYDKQNYSRYLSVYHAQMSALSTTHKQIHEYLEKGGFSVQLGSENPFGRVPIDQALEETANRDTQTAGGTKGFSLRPGAVAKYYLMAEFRSIFLGQIRSHTNLTRSNLSHPDLQESRRARDEADVLAVVDMLENNWVNPFLNSELISLSTAAAATPAMVTDLLKAHKIGEEKMMNFCNDRLQPLSPQDFHARLPRNNLKTFSELNQRKRKIKTSQVDVVIRADRNLFAHMVIIAQSRKLDMKSVFSHPLGPLPLSLSYPDGSIRKTNKSSIARELEKNIIPEEKHPDQSCTLIDGMALVQKIKGDNKTFELLAEEIFVKILQEGYSSLRIDVVFDVYRNMSIKNAERSQRSGTQSTEFKNIAAGHTIRQWRKFLSNSSNKRNLILFLVKEWQREKYALRLDNKDLFVTSEECCFKLGQNRTDRIEELETTQEEADTRLLLHAHHAVVNGYWNIIICADDTDVFLLCLAIQPSLEANLFIKSGTKSRTRLIKVSSVVQVLGQSVCEALPACHAYTGCDTTSAFAGKGKLSALRLLKRTKKFQDFFKQLGMDPTPTESQFKILEEFTCSLYGSSMKNVNDLRHTMFLLKKGELESHQLPPCRDCLYKHSLRACYQAHVWQRALECKPNIPSPNGQGWILEETDGESLLTVDWMSGLPAPEAVLQLLACKCSRTCKLPSCTCLANGLKCTNMCKLQTFENLCTDSDEEDECSDSSDEDETEYE